MTYRWVRLSVANLVLQIYFRMSPVLLPFNIKLKPLESRHLFSTELVKQRFSVTKLLSLEDSGSV